LLRSSRFEPNSAANPFGCLTTPRMIYKDAPHNLRGDSEEMHSLPLHVLLIYKAKILLVNLGLWSATRDR